jgi:hypothetical protein
MVQEELNCLSGESCHFYKELRIKWSGLDIAWLDDQNGHCSKLGDDYSVPLQTPDSLSSLQLRMKETIASENEFEARQLLDVRKLVSSYDR